MGYFLILVAFGSWIYSGRQAKKIRNALGENYEADETYIEFNRLETFSKIAIPLLMLAVSVGNYLGLKTFIFSVSNIFLITAIYTFVKSRFLKRSLGANYSENTNYKIYVNLAKVMLIAWLIFAEARDHISENPEETAVRIQHEQEIAEYERKKAEENYAESERIRQESEANERKIREKVEEMAQRNGNTFGMSIRSCNVYNIRIDGDTATADFDAVYSNGVRQSGTYYLVWDESYNRWATKNLILKD